MIFEISEDDVERSSTLEPEDIGKWCFCVRGTFQGFCDTREKAEALKGRVGEVSP
jgi:hypothetical protein